MSNTSEPGQTLPSGEWLEPLGGHRVWWCEGGDSAGLPVLIVHGGPGGASRAEPAGWFAGLPVRWIALDQRGCGRSTPLGATAQNGLADLLADMERLRERLGLAQWALSGGSWGARVALAYAERRPGRVAGLMLRSPFLGSLAETRRYIAPWREWLGREGEDWLGAGAAEAVFDLYHRPTEALCAGTGLARSFLEDKKIARAWAAFDDAQSAPGGVRSRGSRCAPAALPALSPATAASWRVHAHYALSGWGEHAGHPRGLPRTLPACGPRAVAWGSEDATCDPATARALAAAWPDALANEAAGAGHRLTDPRLAPVLAATAREWVGAMAG